jgi:iron complex outermembrane receptor protein
VLVRVVQLIVLFSAIANSGVCAVHPGITDTTIALDEVVVRSNRLHDFAIGTQIQTIDTFVLLHYRNQSLAELLSAQTAISVNTYGPGGLANISLRGGGTRHTAVIWNGFDLKNPMNACLNFSSLPANFFDGLIVQYGGASTLFGSGATTGSVHLNNTLKLDSGSFLSIGSMAGSFGTFNQSAVIDYSNGSFASATRFLYQSGTNNFKFVNTEKFNDPTEKLENAEYYGYAFLQQNACRISANSIVRSDIWYQKYLKNIPSLMPDYEPGNSKQADENLRVAINLARSSNRLLINMRSGIFADKIIYTDPEQSPADAISNSLSSVSEAEAISAISKNHKLYSGINYTYETASADGYSYHPKRQRTAFFGSYKYESPGDKLSAVINVRQEMVDGSFIPFVYSAGADYECIPNFHLKGNASKNYVLPTFNDLYWAKNAYAEGNPALKPESGYSFESGIRHKLSGNRYSLTNELTGYFTTINNWIIWLPDNEGIWKPDNYNNGETRGVEFTGSAEIKTSEFRHKICYLYSYVDARINEYDQNTGINREKRMIYVPRHKANFNYTLVYRQYSVTSSVSFYSKRYYDYVSQPLDAYLLASISIGRSFELGVHNLDVCFKINNLTNASYQVMSGYAMPPRSFMLGINLKLNKPN